MNIALSPCPNDTYLFHAWIAGCIGKPPTATFADIQQLNESAHRGDYPLIKISFNCYKQVCETYQLLPVGAVLGFHCGPKIISKTPFSIEELPQKKIAIPGEETTAHLLLEKLLPTPKAKHFCLYHEVADCIDQGIVDCGLIIHETRFTFVSMGFSEIIDLGELWHKRYHLPLPLGGLVVRRDYPNKENALRLIQQSLAYAGKNPEASLPFILEHAQEKRIDVVKQHIAAYVNKESEYLSEEGIRAIETLTGLCLDDLLYLPQKMKPKLPYAP